MFEFFSGSFFYDIIIESSKFLIVSSRFVIFKIMYLSIDNKSLLLYTEIETGGHAPSHTKKYLFPNK